MMFFEICGFFRHVRFVQIYSFRTYETYADLKLRISAFQRSKNYQNPISMRRDLAKSKECLKLFLKITKFAFFQLFLGFLDKNSLYVAVIVRRDEHVNPTANDFSRFDIVRDSEHQSSIIRKLRVPDF